MEFSGDTARTYINNGIIFLERAEDFKSSKLPLSTFPCKYRRRSYTAVDRCSVSIYEFESFLKPQSDRLYLPALICTYCYAIQSPFDCLRRQTLSLYMPCQRHQSFSGDVYVCFRLQDSSARVFEQTMLEHTHFYCVQDLDYTRMSKSS